MAERSRPGSPSVPTPPRLRLAIVGDTHYLNLAYHQRALAGETRSPTEPDDVRRHAWTTQRVLPRLIDELRQTSPDVVLQLGDVVQGHCDDDAGNQAELHEAMDFLQQIGRPLLFARGTHEGRPGSPADAVYRQRFLGEVARTLGEPPSRIETSYAFAAAGCRMIVLDYTTFAPGGAADRLLVQQLAEGARRGERILLCGHPPLIPIARPFFTRLEYAKTVLTRLAAAQQPIDAYFCGHTHNQAATLHYLAGGSWLPQLQSVPVGYPAMAPVPLTAVRPILPPAETVRYGWAYLEDSAPGWFLVEAGADEMRVQWRRIGSNEPAGEVRWAATGAPEFARLPAAPAHIPLPAWPIEAGDPRVVGVRLRAAGVGSRAPHRVRLNGVDAGALPILDYFDARQGLAIPAACWDTIRAENLLEIEPVAAEERCLGGFVLEVTLAGGAVLRTAVLPELYATSDRWNAWRWCTPGLRRVDPLAPLRLSLSFTP